MGSLSPRERNESLLFYFGTAIGTAAWWVLLALYPDWKVHFFGAEFGERFSWLFFAPDVISAVVIAPWCGLAVIRSSKLASPLAWVHFGAQGYAMVLAVGMAVIDPSAYWGGLAMALSASLALIFAMRIQGVHILWGPFDFRPAETRSPRENGLRSLGQTFVMWGVFLVLIPLVLVGFEVALGWNVHWIAEGWMVAAGAALFVFGGSMGISAMVNMVRDGEGTPLPRNCANRLVTRGIYRFIRNPMSFGGVIQGVGVSLIVGSPLILLYTVVGLASWEVLVRHLEEEYLEACFGEEYMEYRRRVRCYVPRLSAGD